eukprot:TRINITY_DN10619_c0_g1_i1.p1 TRINITY_DN10619_c0_g1~~TRINITY_DN10619_c0_g1_i1.p1  ORF type:complete len:454 (-),score=122.72 TRINITY_DN10619_c0_g1_i1:19-1380(-)
MSEENNTQLSLLGGVVLGAIGVTALNFVCKNVTEKENVQVVKKQVVKREPEVLDLDFENGHDYSGYGFDTRSIHAGQKPDPYSGAVITPISLSSTFQQYSPGQFYPGAFEYARTGNPTRNALEDCVASLEEGEWGAAFSSGLAGTMTIINLLQAGDHVICMNDVYGGTHRYFSQIASKFGIIFEFVDFNDHEAVKAAITDKTRLLWLETPTNPNLTIVDIEAIANISKQHKDIIFVVDNTFMSSYFQRPLTLGADLVIHSMTKFMNGHSDVVMGMVIGRDQDLKKRIKFLQNAVGAIPSPFDSFLVLRSLKTLHVRMRQHGENAQRIAEYLESRSDVVDRVSYPGLASHPQHEIAQKQMNGFGGVVTFFLKGGIDQARQFLENVSVFALAESLGGVESLVDHPAIMTHAAIPAEERKKLGISDSLIRLSVGIENIDDLLADLENALSHVVLEE